MNFLKDKNFLHFLVKFLVVFAICYYGTLLVIGLSAPQGYHVDFVEHYLNYITVLRSSLLHATKFLLSVFGVDTYFASRYNLKMVNGRGIILVYECIGYGVMSFWIAFVVASVATTKKKIIWLILGLAILWILNVCRLSLLLVATNRGWPMPLGWDHHTWFNIIAYLFIFLMMYLFQRNTKPKAVSKANNK